METVSRRSVIGIAATVIASGAIARETAAACGTPDENPQAAPGEPANAKSDSVYKFRMGDAPARQYGESSVREHKLHEFPMSASLSGSLVTLAPGDVREPHWHPNSDEWLFVMSGAIRMTIVDGKGAASQFDCGLEDVAFVPQGFGHYIESIGDAEAQLVVIHNNAEFTTVNLSEWVAGGATGVFASTLNMPVQAFDEAPTKRAYIVTRQDKG